MSAIGNPVTKNNPDNVEEKFADIIFLEDELRNDISNGQDVHDPSSEDPSTSNKPIPNSIHAKLDNLESSVNSLGSEFQEKIKNDQHKDQIEKFTTIAARAGFEGGRKTNFISRFLGPIFTFLKMYFFKLGILDGYYGFVIAWKSSKYKYLKESKLLELYRSK